MFEGELVLYRTQDGLSEIQLRAVDGTVWLTQAQMAELFQTSPQAITQLIKSIYRERELTEEATCKNFLQVREEGGRRIQRALKSYRLEMILAVGFRVRSDRGTQFRQWATTALNQYLVRGFVINDRRLKDPAGFDYFDELLERIRDIRASEKRFYQKVRDLFAETSADYDSKSDTAQVFFKTIQNKMLFAVIGHTAAELIVSRASADRPNMGLTAWKGARVRKGDVTVAKNYLTHEETSWITQTDRFLAFHERNVLGDAGRVSHERMEAIVLGRFDDFDGARRGCETTASDEESVDELKRIAASSRPPGEGEDDD